MTKRRTSQRKIRNKSRKVRRRRSKKITSSLPTMPSLPIPPIPLIPVKYKKGVTLIALLAALAYLIKDWSPSSAADIKKIGDDVLGALSIAGGPIPPEPGAPKQWNQKVGIVKGQAKWLYDFIIATDRFKQRLLPPLKTP